MSQEAFELLLASNLQLVRRLVRKQVEAAHADDVVQEILLRAFARRDQLRMQASFRTWLWSITLNQIRQHFRERDRRVVSLDYFPDFDIRDNTMSPLARLEWLERRDWLRARMAELPDRDQAAIWLRDIEEKSVGAAAAALNRSVPATKTAHFRARKRLAEIIRASAHRSGCAPIRYAA